ncbi:MAG: hypothetical protein GF329_10110 [Candidatus Lokiarchaeota archaeon]|nr:hypothetical protein [Candidatus Lokiarchaeota archaeon]
MEKSNVVRKIAGLPFKVFNKEAISVNQFVYTLSLNILKDCNIDMARKILRYAIEKNWIKRENDTLLTNIEIDMKSRMLFDLKIDFDGLKNINMEDLETLPEIQTFKPVKKKIIEPVSTVPEYKSSSRITTSVKKKKVADIEKESREKSLEESKETSESKKKEERSKSKQKTLPIPEAKDESEDVERQKKSKKKKKKEKIKSLDSYFNT